MRISLVHGFEVESELLQRRHSSARSSRSSLRSGCSFMASLPRIIAPSRLIMTANCVERSRLMQACSKIAKPPASRITYCFMIDRHRPPKGDGTSAKSATSFTAQERVAKIAELAQRISVLQAGRDAEIKELKDEVARLQAELAKVVSP